MFKIIDFFSHPGVVVGNVSQKLSGRIIVANRYLCNSELIRLDIATEVSERFDCEFIRLRNFMISGHSFLSDYNLHFRPNKP